MTSPTTNRGMTYPTHAGGVGTWDGNLNANFEILDLALGGYYPITISSTTITTFSSGSASIPSSATSITIPTSLAQNLFFNITGPSSQNLTINVPAAGSPYIFAENSSGSATISLQPTGGSGVTLPHGGQAIVITNSTGANFAQNAFGAITTQSIANSSGITTTGPLTQNSSQYEQLASGPTASRPGAPIAGYFRYNSTLNAIEWWNGTIWAGPGVNPTVLRIGSGITADGSSHTATPTTGVVRWRVTMCGAGGSGGYTGTGGGATGGTTSFGSWTCIGGGPGINGAGSKLGGGGGQGGADGTGTRILRVNGGGGAAGAGATTGPGGQGGSNPFGGGGQAGLATIGFTGQPNTGAGGGGSGGGGTQTGGGGGAGEWVSFWVFAPTATTYTVGLGGVASGTGTAGGNGADGNLFIEEFYQ